MTRECKHPPAYLSIRNHGLVVACGSCGLERRLTPGMVEMLMAAKAGDKAVAGEPYGPTLADMVTIAARQNMALRSMGRAFWNEARSKQQEDALKLATACITGFTQIRPRLASMLDMIAVTFGEAEIAKEPEPVND